MTSFRMFEIILYSMVSLLPYLGLALYPFEDKFRISKIKLSGCIVIRVCEIKSVNRHSMISDGAVSS